MNGGVGGLISPAAPEESNTRTHHFVPDHARGLGRQPKAAPAPLLLFAASLLRRDRAEARAGVMDSPASAQSQEAAGKVI